MSQIAKAPQSQKRPKLLRAGLASVYDLDSSVVEVTSATFTLNAASHAGRLVVLNLAAGIAVTLPPSAGTGDTYRLHVKTTFTGAATVKVANATDVMQGMAILGIDGGTLVPHLYPTGATADTIDMLGTANSTGGVFGEYIELQDILTGFWRVLVIGDAGGTEATPFSATVS